LQWCSYATFNPIFIPLCYRLSWVAALAAAFLTGTFPLYFCKKRYSKQFAIQIKNQEQISNHSGSVISDDVGFFLIGLFNTVLMMKLGYIHK